MAATNTVTDSERKCGIHILLVLKCKWKIISSFQIYVPMTSVCGHSEFEGKPPCASFWGMNTHTKCTLAI